MSRRIGDGEIVEATWRYSDGPAGRSLVPLSRWESRWQAQAERAGFRVAWSIPESLKAASKTAAIRAVERHAARGE